MQSQPQSMQLQTLDLRKSLDMIRRRKLSIALVAVLVPVLALGVVARRPPLYTSDVVVEVNPLTTDQQLQASNGSTFVNMDTESARVTQDTVAGLAASTLHLDDSSPAALADLVKGVRVSIPTNTTNLEIACTEATAEKAQLCATAFADAYITDRIHGAKAAYGAAQHAVYARIAKANKLIHQLVEEKRNAPAGDRAPIQRQIQEQQSLITAAQTTALALPTASPTAAVLARSADLPVKPSNRDYVRTGMLAALLGLALGIALAFIRERLDEHVGDRAGFEATLSAPVLATVPRVRTWNQTRDRRLITRDAPQSQAAEAYRAVRPPLTFVAKRDSMKVVAVTSPDEREATSTVTANLAVSLAVGGANVVAVCCDLRQPRLHLFFGRSNQRGLTDVLTGKLPWRDVLQHTDVDGVSIVASGPAPDNPAELLGRDEMRTLLADLRKEFDLILLDTAPALIVADTVTLVSDSDGVLIVANALKTTRASVAHLRDQFEQVGGYVIGGILTEVSRDRGNPYWSYERPQASEASRDTPRTHRDSGPNLADLPAAATQDTTSSELGDA